MKTVFGEEIEVDDKIMYIYKGTHGSLVISFGEVTKIEYKKRYSHADPVPEMHVHKTYEISHESKVCDKNIILRNPTIFKCGQELKYPD